MTTTFSTIDDAHALVCAVASSLPAYHSYGALGGKPYVRSLQIGTGVIPAADVPATLDRVRSIPDSLTADVALPAAWRDLDLSAALRAWGWTGNTMATGDVHLGGMWGDVLIAEQFAILTALNCASLRDAWIFSADLDPEPVFAVQLTTDGVQLLTNVSVEYSIG